MLDLLKYKLKVDIESRDIEAVHRVGKIRSGEQPPRGIIIRFISRRVRDTVMTARKSLKGTKIIIVEDLTPRTHSLLKDVHMHPLCAQVWTKFGQVIAKTTRGVIVNVEKIEDLNK